MNDAPGLAGLENSTFRLPLQPFKKFKKRLNTISLWRRFYI